MMTPEKLTELEALEAAATQGPWPVEDEIGDDDTFYMGDGAFASMGPVHLEEACHKEGEEAACAVCADDDTIANMKSVADQRLIHALRNNARDLFAALREAWRERDEAREKAKGTRESWIAVMDENTKLRVLVNKPHGIYGFLGPCAHGRDPYTRCEEGCGELSGEDACEAAWAAARKERDELAEELAFIKKEYGETPIEELTGDAIGLKVALLTRERDEALLEKRAIYGSISVMARYLGMDATELICNPSRVLESEAAADKERDEARASLDVAYSKGRADERDFSRVVEERLTQERDEARVRLCLLDEQRHDWGFIHDSLKADVLALLKQCAEARAALKLLKKQYDTIAGFAAMHGVTMPQEVRDAVQAAIDGTEPNKTREE